MEGFFIAAVFLGIPYILGSLYRSNLAHQRFMKVLQLKADMNARLLERLGAEPTVLEFLKSEVQQQMFDVKLPEPTPRLPTSYSRMLTAIQIGCMLLSAGTAFLYIRHFMPVRSQEELLVFGALGVALGVGSLLSAAAAYIVGSLARNLEESKA